MDRVRLWIPTDELAPGTVLEAYGSARGAALDWTQRVGPRRRVSESAYGFDHHGPFAIGLSFIEPRPVVVDTPPLGPGLYEFGVKAFDPQSGAAAAGTPSVASIYVQSAPRPHDGLTPVEQPISGAQLRFTFTRSPDL